LNTAKPPKLRKNTKFLSRINFLRLCGIISLILPFLFCEYGCAPTYPKEKVASSIVKMCKEQYNIEVIAKLADNTVGAYLALDDMLDISFALTKEAGEKIGNVVLVIQRAVLSTNANIEFYTVTVADKKLPSMEFKMAVHVKDIKRALTMDISRGEYYERIARQMKLNLDNLADTKDFNVLPIKLPDFLAEQIGERLKYKFEKDKTLKVTKTYGEFKNERFSFDLDIVNKADDKLGYLNPEKNEELLRKSLELIDFVVRRYEFKDFKEIEVKNAGNQEALRIKKEDLPKVRKNKKLIYSYITPANF
jgi:hypothetical protein